ncbi:sulfate permease ii [Stemphylium lycopersici]|uniref:Sulfate permease ii n=1 Tax=Stemphylium lycopersici TaxID=183478 RepID=A0A364N8E7_STELY|nr:sulfate permease ii [Stemphylium lycopersici]RAR13598.1 sulfate permease ii [Stemphylium lycopersici]
MSSTSRRMILVASSVSLLLFIAISLSTAIEVRGPSPQVIQINLAQAARVGENDDVVAAKALLNGTDFDRGDVLNGSSTVPGVTLEPSIMTETQEGMIGFTPEPQSSASWSAEGVLGSMMTPTPSAVSAPVPQPPSPPQLPILALTYSGAGGPKHCRGELLQKTYFPPPVEKWKNGTCVNLPSEARCGVFVSNKGDNCEAQLFNMPDCYNTTRSYINTVVFMPEERPVGALWSSMWVRCGVEVPEAKMLDPSILGGALKKPSGS